MSRPPAGRASWFIWGAALVLFFLHQDFWLWDDTTLLWGFMPIGLAYHAAFSVAAAMLWALAVRYAWPRTLEQDATESTHEP